MSGELRNYTVVVNGRETVLRLNDADAEAAGLKVEPAEKPKARRPANKQRPAANK